MLDARWAVALSFALTTSLILLLIPLARRFRLVDQPGGRKRHAAPTPLVGGFAMSLGIAVALASTASEPGALGPLIAGSTLLVVFGAVDDTLGLDYRARLAVQSVSAMILVFWGGLRIESLGNLFGFGSVDLGLGAVPFTIFAVVGLINAINMLDGLDGLAGSAAFAMLGPVLVYCQLQDLDQVLLPGLAIASSILAFLLFNYRFPWRDRARVFMGDAGSNFLGFALAWIVLSINDDSSSGLYPISILWILAFPVADTLSTIWRRHRKRKSAFQPDHDHMHFIVQRAGFSINTTVLIISSVTALCALAGLAGSMNKLPEPLLTLGLLFYFLAHNLLLTHAWRIAKGFRQHLTAVAEPSDD